MVLIESGLVLIVLGAVLYWLLNRHEKRRVANGKSRHSALRLVVIAFGLMLLSFSGGCSLLFGLAADGMYVTWEAVAVIGGPPVVIGLLIWFIASRRGSDDKTAA